MAKLTQEFLDLQKEKVNSLDTLRENLPLLISTQEKPWAIHRTAELLTQKHSLRTFNDTDEIRYYNDGTYHSHADALLGGEIEAVWGKDASTHVTKEILNHCRRGTYLPRESWNPKGYINLQNGVIDTANGELLPPTPERPFTYSLPLTYNPDAQCPNIEKFFAEVFRPEDIPTAHELVGYCLYTGYPIQRAVLLFGGGTNGKSTFINLLKTFLGPENTTSISIQQLAEDTYSKSWLYGKLANLYADLEPAALKNTGVFKMLTGGDMITCNVKYGKDSLTFTNHAKMVFSANRFPQVYDDSDAFFRRWIILRFDRIFSDTEVDPNILERLTTPNELSGLLNLALIGLRRLLTSGRFTSTKGIDDTRDEYIRNSDTVGAFILDCIEQGDPDDEEYRTLKDEVYNLYIRYTKSRKLQRKNEVWFWKDFRGRIEYWTGREKVGGLLHQVLKGIKVKESDNNKQGIQGKGGTIVCTEKQTIIGESIGNTLFTLSTLSSVEATIGDEIETASLYAAFVGPDVSKEQLAAIVQELKDKGRIYEPKPGVLKVVGLPPETEGFL